MEKEDIWKRSGVDRMFPLSALLDRLSVEGGWRFYVSLSMSSDFLSLKKIKSTPFVKRKFPCLHCCVKSVAQCYSDMEKKKRFFFISVPGFSAGKYKGNSSVSISWHFCWKAISSLPFCMQNILCQLIFPLLLCNPVLTIIPLF